MPAPQAMRHVRLLEPSASIEKNERNTFNINTN
jgi:hypothetical protein